MNPNSILFATATALLKAATPCIRKAHDTCLILPADFNGVCFDVYNRTLSQKEALIRLYGLAHPDAVKLPSVKILNALNLDGEAIHKANHIHLAMQPEHHEVIQHSFFDVAEGTKTLDSFIELVEWTLEPEVAQAA